jgi:hypothetical protein
MKVRANYKLQRTVSQRGRTVRALDGARGPVREQHCGPPLNRALAVN